MKSIFKTQISKDLINKKVVISRDFAASVNVVWDCWTQQHLLDQWWAPKPWKSVTKTLDFTEGGFWLYYMVGPDGTQIWARIDYTKIENHNFFEAIDSFCDKDGNKTSDFPSMSWKNSFQAISDYTQVIVEITFDSVSDLEKIIEMGFEEGFTAAHSNLDELLAKQ